MPQELRVLQCYDCKFFQVDIVKKIPKWNCKMCGEKQSVKQVYFAGAGKDCRKVVQNLNKNSSENEKIFYTGGHQNVDQEEVCNEERIKSEDDEDFDEDQEEINEDFSIKQEFIENSYDEGNLAGEKNKITQKKSSKWNLFTEKYESLNIPATSENVDDEKLLFETPQENKGIKRKRNEVKDSNELLSNKEKNVNEDKWNSSLKEETTVKINSVMFPNIFDTDLDDIDSILDIVCS